MKTVFKFLTAVLAMATFGLTACSNNDDEPKNDQPVEPSYKNVLSQGLPTEVDGCSFTTNDKDQVTSISYDNSVEVTFEYGEFTQDGKTYDILMKVLNWYGGGDLYIQTNNQGFATHALEIHKESDSETWDFEYNSDGQLAGMIRTRNADRDDRYQFSYTNGDLTKMVKDHHDGKLDEDDHYELEFKYTDEAHPNGIPNKGNLMFYEDIFCGDMDEMDMTYYAGLLGKSTKNLPLEGISTGMFEKYNWILNSNGLPTELKINLTLDSGYGHTSTYTYRWK